MSEYIISRKQIEELNRAHHGMEIVTSWLSCYSIWDTTNTYPTMKSKHVAVMLPEIVRCRDCRRYRPKKGKMLACRFEYKNLVQWRYAEPDGFCAWGERPSLQQDQQQD